MTPIKIILFILASFFRVENGKTAADRTTVTVSPKIKEVEIVLENLFAFIHSKEDSVQVVEEWSRLYNKEEKGVIWTEVLDDYPVKEIAFVSVENEIHPQLTLSYSEVSYLKELEIEYNSESNQYSIENPLEYHISTNDGELIDDHWVFGGDSAFSFIIEPFLDLPDEYQELKRPLKELLENQ